ncbi:hypothetical protein A2899_00690 [Candidatus Amesbacteria bacterium RIFCSPLOWO2_01_FULL_49_25]|uniref:Glycosyltransferase RgtA/B/C/D-like domain-containing protein n=1 Tax=Candidatus Amesbacteria bacterium RIFCSPHIGHO2_01_FULL_48_32b TaxID=1797253 RepID=A0A1F4YCS6_9BACT|nr:MAG: hypothetical protein A2876_01555 [Candidatus Amesbacteria bacterium RIFCSPHIGHO2_01_FULL_48_32b]OGD08026.1 MAG: hypothetical protein A2899_00690 [Candidatus Amesbacteria bacterium RIFCSPLOWO2_01_FULL_49_25]
MAFWLKKIISVGVVLGVAVWSVWPVIVNPSRVADFGSDGWFINWVINRQVKIITGCIRIPGECKNTLFQGNIYYPNRDVLAYSDLHGLDAIEGIIPVILSKNPGVASGWAMALGQIATMIIIYKIWVEFFGNKWGATVGAVAFGLSQIRWEYQVHLHTWTMQWWLVGLWFMFSWLKGGRWWKGLMGAVLLGLQAWESILPVYFAATVVAIYVILNFKPAYRTGRSLILNKHVVLNFLVFIFVAGGVMWPVVGVYSRVARENGFVRTIRDAANGGMSVDDLWGKFYSPGLFVLFGVALLKLIIPHSNPSPKFSPADRGFAVGEGNYRWLLAVVVVGLVMAMGPVLKWQGRTVKIAGKYPVPLPYAAAYYVVPGWGAFRTPSRWIWLAGWAGSGIVALALSRYQARNIFGVLGALVVAVIGGTHLTKYVNLPGEKDLPKVYRWLTTRPERVIGELPVGGDERESVRMYYSWWHGKDLVGGLTGFAPITRGRPELIVMHKLECASGGCGEIAGRMIYEDEESAVYRFW